MCCSKLFLVTYSSYHNANFSSLFRPYIKLDLRAANLYPHDTCTFCANEISKLMNALRAMYGLRRVCLAVTNILLSASTIHLLNLPSESAAVHLSQGLNDLEAMSTNHRFAARAVDIIRSLSSKWNIALPEGAAAVAVYRLGAQRNVSSPPPSTFFAASIPRNRSSEGRSRSGNSSVPESPFTPPTTNPHQHTQNNQRGPTSVPMFYSDPQTQLDPSQAATAFWTPFPTQVMPINQHDLHPAMMDVSQFGGQHQWPQFSVSGTGQHPYRHQSDPGYPAPVDESMSGVGDWGWE